MMSTDVRLQVGQVWQSRDKREKGRRIKIVQFQGDTVIVQRQDKNSPSGRKPITKVQAASFRLTGSRGFDLVEEAPPKTPKPS